LLVLERVMAVQVQAAQRTVTRALWLSVVPLLVVLPLGWEP
jgi:hypothetical protein